MVLFWTSIDCLRIVNANEHTHACTHPPRPPWVSSREAKVRVIYLCIIAVNDSALNIHTVTVIPEHGSEYQNVVYTLKWSLQTGVNYTNPRVATIMPASVCRLIK